MMVDKKLREAKEASASGEGGAEIAEVTEEEAAQMMAE